MIDKTFDSYIGSHIKAIQIRENCEENQSINLNRTKSDRMSEKAEIKETDGIWKVNETL